jgi:nucleotide-binding universal stress UspA family protein
MLPSRILVATDGSPSSKAAEAFAAGEVASLLLGSTSHEIVRGAHCPVTIIHV